MLIAIDGACKRNGQPNCLAVGVAWFETEDGEYFYHSTFEQQSTSQRGEIYGLINALLYAKLKAAKDETIIIITDSEYLYNTVTLEWYDKWERNNWVGGSGDTVKNVDLWKAISNLLRELNADEPRVFMQWTKGHLIHYTPGNIKQAMIADDGSGVELYSRIAAVANRVADKDRIIDDFIRLRKEHDKPSPPRDTCLEWAIANTMADSLASYIVNIVDANSSI